jgi:hypothetical protein
MAKVSKKPKHRPRTERRYTTSGPGKWVVPVAGAVSALAMGAGTYAQLLRAADAPPIAAAPWLLAGGALGLAAAIWFGGPRDAIRVGDGGIAIERGGALQRMPWYAVTSISVNGDALIVEGKDDGGAACSLRVSRAKDGNVAGRIAAEASARIPKVVNLGDEGFGYDEQAGVVVRLEALHLAGRRCTASGTTIAFESDARLCPKCERVYNRAHVPAACGCGAPLNG